MQENYMKNNKYSMKLFPLHTRAHACACLFCQVVSSAFLYKMSGFISIHISHALEN
jgi:hypothetical protein